MSFAAIRAFWTFLITPPAEPRCVQRYVTVPTSPPVTTPTQVQEASA